MLEHILRAFVLAGLVACAAGPVRADETRGMLLRTDQSEALLEEARHHLLSFRMRAAERTLRQLAAQPDGAAAAYLYLAQLALFEGLMAGDEDRLVDFFDRSDSLKRVLDAAPRSRWRDYMEAETNLQRALASAKRGNYVKSALAARSAFGGFERLVRAYPDFSEPYKGLGLLHIAIGSLPGGYRGLLKVLGYRGTVQGGLAELDRAARQSAYNREEALVYGALTRAILYGEHSAGAAVLQRLHAAYPDSPLFGYLYGFLLLSDRRAAEAERVLRPLARRADDPAYFYPHYADFYLADALFKLGRFAEAETYYRRYLDRHEGPALKAMTHLGLGLALELQGRRAEALDHYRRVESSRGFDSDDVARRAARRYLAAPIAGRTHQLLLARIAFDAGRYADAVPILEGVLADPQASADERAEAYYRLGRVHQAAGRADEALRAYQHAIDQPGAPELGRAPWSQFYIGEIHAGRGDKAQAKAAFEKARAYKGSFDYAQALEQNVKAALERLDAGS